MGYFQIYLYTQFVHDWQKSYEIVRSFLNQQGIRGFSYNGYIGMGEPLSHITIRFNFENDKVGKQNIESVIDSLLEKRLIVGKSQWSPFQTTKSVARATEVSTKCAFAFIEWMNKHETTLKNYLANPNYRFGFMSRFVVILLQQLGFKAHFESYPISESVVELIRNCAEYCANQIREDFSLELDIVFMERVIHHFLNCIHIDSAREEPSIYSTIGHWEWLGNLLERREKHTEKKGK